MILLWDADILLFKVLYIYQSIHKGKKCISKKLLTKCLLQVINNYLDKFSPHKVVMMCKLFPCKYFRHHIDPDYKKDRSPTPEEILVLREILQTLNFTLYSSDCIETDDLIGLYMSGLDSKEELICLSGDKDLLQIPGVHASFYNDKVNLVTEHGEFALDRKTHPLHPKLHTTGFIHFCKQMISGDKTDNIKGIAGLGDVKIHSYLDTWDAEDISMINLLEKVVELYNRCNYHNVKTFNQNLNLLWILRIMNDSTRESLELIMPCNELQTEIVEDKLTFRDFLNYSKD